MSETMLYSLGLSAVALVIVGLGAFAGYRRPAESRFVDVCVGLVILLAVPAGWMSAELTGWLSFRSFMGLLVFGNLLLLMVVATGTALLWRLVHDWRAGRRGRNL